MAVAFYNKISMPVKSRESSQLSSSSTPHAPRRKLYTSDFPTPPSVRTILKKHIYLDETRIKLTNNTKGSASPKPVEKAQAWVEKQVTPPSSTSGTVVTVKPFRRTLGPKPPEGIPPLDLSHLNEPDDTMQPIQLLVPPLASDDTQRSNLSWGLSVPMCGYPGNSVAETENRTPSAPQDCEVVEDLECTNEPQSHSSVVESSKMVQTSPAPSLPLQERGLGNLVLGQQAVEAALAKRISFGARILTQNGRNAHKKLCGYFFLTDDSIAVYEFKQLGPRSSAFPVIQRRIYYHLLGRKKGQPYQINTIKKGATLYFNTKDHPSLPKKGSNSIIGIRVTSVDENIKRQILFADKSLAEQRALEEYINESASYLGEKEEGLLHTLQGMLRSRLQGRASKTLVGLGRHLEKIADSNGLVGRNVLHQALRTFHIGLTHEDFEHLWDILKITGVCSSDGLHVDGSVLALVGEMSEERKVVILKVFQKLDSHRTGVVSSDEMHKFFNPHSHPDVIEGKKSPEEAWFALFNCLCPSTNDITVCYRDFEHYYEGVSIETKSDTSFMSSIKNYWGLC